MFEMDDKLLIALLLSLVGWVGMLFLNSSLEDDNEVYEEFIQQGVDNGHLIYHPQTSELTFTTCEAEE